MHAVDCHGLSVCATNERVSSHLDLWRSKWKMLTNGSFQIGVKYSNIVPRNRVQGAVGFCESCAEDGFDQVHFCSLELISVRR